MIKSEPGTSYEACPASSESSLYRQGYYYYAVKDQNRELTLGTLIERNAERHGDRPAVLYDDRAISWSEFNGWANRIAHFLQNQGLTKGDAIAVFLENRQSCWPLSRARPSWAWPAPCLTPLRKARCWNTASI